MKFALLEAGLVGLGLRHVCHFYRVTVFSNYSLYNVPDISKHWSLMCEVSDSAHKPVDHATLMESVIQGALNTALITSREEIIST